MERIRVGLAERSYTIYAGCGILPLLGELCRKLQLQGSAAVITNTTVAPLYLQQVKNSLQDEGYAVTPTIIPDGEEFKNSATLELIYDGLLSAGLDRGAFIIALGGGVVGDMAGFAAATFLRGIPFVQVPTTLLAQVDSSVGGKTGINHPLGKNLIGAFHQPAMVLIDLDTLDTLPEAEYISGLAEVVKYGVVLDRDFFEFIAAETGAVKSRDKRVLLHLVSRACTIKAAVVERDEREGGVRAVLNYGHTLGHAVETLAGYGAFKHGEAVAIGMAQIARLSQLRGLASAADAERIIRLLADLGLPVALPEFPPAEYEKIIEHDKKKRDDGVNFIFNQGIGGFVIEKVTDIGALLADCRAGV